MKFLHGVDACKLPGFVSAVQFTASEIAISGSMRAFCQQGDHKDAFSALMNHRQITHTHSPSKEKALLDRLFPLHNKVSCHGSTTLESLREQLLHEVVAFNCTRVLTEVCPFCRAQMKSCN